MTEPLVWSPEESGIDEGALRRYIDEQIYSLPGVDRHREVFTVLLTGSRALGNHTPDSDVDIDVLCPEEVYTPLQRACREAGVTKSREAFWCPLSLNEEENWRRYFGGDSVPHFCVNTLESVERQFMQFDDVGMWIWSNARVIADPGGQFGRILRGFEGYPADVLVRKLKYHWLMCWSWGIEVYPFHHQSDDELLTAGAAIFNTILEMMRVFFLVEGRPYPYTEKLPHFVGTTKLGAWFGPVLRQWVEIALGQSERELGAWERLDKASGLLLDDMNNPDTVHSRRKPPGRSWRQAWIRSGWSTTSPTWTSCCSASSARRRKAQNGPVRSRMPMNARIPIRTTRIETIMVSPQRCSR